MTLRSSCVLASGVLAAMFCAVASAQTDQKLLFADWKKDATFETTADALLFQRASMGGASPASSASEYTATGRVRLDTSREINPSFGYDVYVLDTSDPMNRVPGRLTDASMAFATPIAKVDDWFLAFSVGAGYAGDKAFGNSDSWYGIGTFSAGTELSSHEQLLLWIEYNGNHTLFPDVPIPFIAYANQVSESFSFVLGIPESDLEWHPTDRLTVKLEWDAPFTIDAGAELELSKGVTLLARFQDQTHAFHAEGLKRIDRIFYSERRAEAGIRLDPFEQFGLVFAAGYAFGREFQQGFDDRNLDRITRFGDTPYVRLGIDVKF